ncbi:beta-ketoacyl synthase N-terminal-like domain-containing protein [Dactylosporangium sp. CA-092794]|uniref:beta-ketoacyl synthase N-terminal-like domain-containing protein n=1 Tax=Dactylosporangium sp. CA-092794 TaxID=3239929 RepID=UPI003D8BE1C6
MSEGTAIAIVGMAAVMPGAGSVEAYWRNLVDGVDAITDLPANRWDDEFYDPQHADRPDRVYCRRGGFIDEYATFDPLRFGIMPASVGDIEPDQLIALEVAAAAVEDAGGTDRLPEGDRVGVILGRGGILSPAQARYAQRVRMSSQVVLVLRELLPELDPARLELVRQKFDERLGPQQPEGTIGLVPNLTASRVANRLNLRGPAYTLDAACASSLIAVDQGITELVNGRLDAVLAGGVHHVHDISFWSVFSQLRALSRKGEIRPFDASADGLLIGEGTGIVVLKRLDDAVRDGDRIHAVIRGSGTSSDGRSASMFNPASSGQALAMRRAWQAAGLDPAAPDALGLLEAHGTATPTGDAAELTSVAEVFGPDRGGERPVIGSVKSMIGHTMPAAGIAGLIKAVLAVSRGVLLPTLHCDAPRAELAGTRFQPVATARPWDGTGPRRAGVNAFGFGGINAHVIVEEPPARRGTRSARPAVEEPDRVLWLAAADPAGLARQLEADGPRLRERADLVPAAQPCRLGLVNPSDERLALARKAVERGRAWRGGRDVWYSPQPLLAGATPGRLAFVFPGIEAEFTPRVDDVAAHFGLRNRDWSDDDLGRHGAGVIEVGKLLHEALVRIGVTPDVVAGHSLGEWAAASVTGLMSTASMEEFLDLFHAETVEVEDHAFAVIGAGVQRVEGVLGEHPGVVLSHDNAPGQCIVNGPVPRVEALIASLRRDNVLCQVLPFRSSFHTPAFGGGLAAIGEALRHWQVGTPDRPVWSATAVAPFPADPRQVSDLFVRHMIEPVRFRPMIAAMHDAGVRVFLQVGPGQLASVVDDNLRGQDHLAMPVNVAHRSGLNQLRRVATALWVEGAEPNLAALGAPAAARPARRGPRVKLDLGGPLVRLGEGASGLLGITGGAHTPPAVLDTLDRLSGASSAAAELSALLRETASSAARVMTVTTPPAPAVKPAPPAVQPAPQVHRSTLRVGLDTMPYLRDHCFFVQPDDWDRPEDRWPVVPATAVVQHMMDAVERIAPGGRVVAVHGAKFNRWVIAAPAQDIELTVQPAGPGRWSVSFGGYARATIEVADGYPQPPAPFTTDPAGERPPTISAEEMYAERLMFHGPLFRGVTAVHALGDRHVRGVVTAPQPPGALLDNALQLLGNWLISTQPSRTVALPVGLEHVRFFGPPPAPGTAFDCVARVTAVDDGKLVADTQLIVGGRVWAVIEGATDRRFDSHPSARPAERFPERNPMSRPQPEGWTVVFDAWTDLVTRGMAARGILGGDAYASYEAQPPTGRKQWLLGRIAAKDAVRFRQWDAGHTDVFPIELTIVNDPNGRPRARLREGRGYVGCDLSLAHCAEVAVAIAKPGDPGDGPGVGIDVAEVAQRPPSTVTFFFSAEEADLLDARSAGGGGDRDLWFTRFWVAKEAVAKAEGTGLGGNPRRFTVTAATPDELTVAVAGRTYRVRCREIANPEDLTPRRYVVGWTWGPEES